MGMLFDDAREHFQIASGPHEGHAGSVVKGERRLRIPYRFRLPPRLLGDVAEQVVAATTYHEYQRHDFTDASGKRGHVWLPAEWPERAVDHWIESRFA